MLKGKLVNLRPLCSADAATIFGWRNRIETIVLTLGQRFPVTDRLDAQWLEKALGEDGHDRVILGIEDRRSRKLAGIIQIKAIDWISRHGKFAITIGDPEKRGRGLGSEAMSLFFAYLRDVLNLRRVLLEVGEFNAAAIKAYEKAGFKREGLMRGQYYYNGKYHGVVLMALSLQK